MVYGVGVSNFSSQYKKMGCTVTALIRATKKCRLKYFEIDPREDKIIYSQELGNYNQDRLKTLVREIIAEKQ